jgi:hypothetical protein
MPVFVSELCVIDACTLLKRCEVGIAGIQEQWDTSLKTCKLNMEAARKTLVTFYVLSELMSHLMGITCSH